MKRIRPWLGGVVACFRCFWGEGMESIDFATGAWNDVWLRHPVLGDASFDTFAHASGNPGVRHAVRIQSTAGCFPMDCIEVICE